MTRQRKFQIRQNKKGLCAVCNKKLITKKYCRKHADQNNKYSRNWHRKKGNILKKAQRYIIKNKIGKIQT
jgi:hypothetical protein